MIPALYLCKYLYWESAMGVINPDSVGCVQIAWSETGETFRTRMAWDASIGLDHHNGRGGER